MKFPPSNHSTLRSFILLTITVLALSSQARAAVPPPKIIGMYVHQHWPYNHPYAARTWTLDDWHGYADGLHRLGYNTILLWPVLETMPDPLTPSDQDNLDKITRVIDMLHDEFHMRAYIALCPNIIANNDEARKATFQQRHFFSCDLRVNPGDPAALKHLIDWRAKLLAPLRRMDGLTIIDSDPGGYVDSSNAEFVNLLDAHRQMLDTLRPNIELVYWMHSGWRGYGRFYKTGDMNTPTTDAERLETLELLKAKNPAPWGLANGLAFAQQLGIADKVISFNYGLIEGEPSFPITNFGGPDAYNGGASPGPRGVMGNAQTHCIQLPNTFAFVRGAQGKPVTETDHITFANDLLPGYGAQIVQAWKSLAGSDPKSMRNRAAELEAIPADQLRPGPLKGLLFGDPHRFMTDLAMMLRTRAGFLDLQSAVNQNNNIKPALTDFLTALKTWQHQNGYENSIYWGGLDETVRKLSAPEINTVLDNRFNPFAPAKLLPGETPFNYVARKLREEESCTPRLIKALESAQQELH